jgi:hypothetical protein
MEDNSHRQWPVMVDFDGTKYKKKPNFKGLTEMRKSPQHGKKEHDAGLGWIYWFFSRNISCST